MTRTKQLSRFILSICIAYVLIVPSVRAEDYFQTDLAQSISKSCTKAGQPYFFDHARIPASKKTGIILIHGYTANPSDTILLGRYLYQKGYTVYGVRLEGHGTSPQDLKRTNWQEWYASVEQAYAYMGTKAQGVHCIGISMGGLLALELASNKKLDSLVLLAPALVPRDKKAFLTRFFVPVADLLHIDLGYISVVQTEANKDHFYGKNPIRTVYQLVKLIREVKPALSRITVPVLIMQDKNDASASPGGAVYIIDHIGSKQKKMIFHDKGHVFTDRYEPVLFNEIYTFIDSIGSTGTQK